MSALFLIFLLIDTILASAVRDDITLSINKQGIEHIINIVEEIFDLEAFILNFTISGNTTEANGVYITYSDFSFSNFTYSNISINFDETGFMVIKLSNVSLSITSIQLQSKYQILSAIQMECNGDASAKFIGWDFDISINLIQNDTYCHLPLSVNESSIIIYMYNDKLKVDYSLSPSLCTIFEPFIDILLTKLTVSTLPLKIGDEFRKIILRKVLPFSQQITYNDTELAVLCYLKSQIVKEEDGLHLEANIDLITNQSDFRWDYINEILNPHILAPIEYVGDNDMYHIGFTKGVKDRKETVINIIIAVICSVIGVIIIIIILRLYYKKKKKTKFVKVNKDNQKLVEILQQDVNERSPLYSNQTNVLSEK